MNQITRKITALAISLTSIALVKVIESTAKKQEKPIAVPLQRPTAPTMDSIVITQRNPP
jgi:hypothetical protein